MFRRIFFSLALVTVAVPAAAQVTTPPSSGLNITLDEVERRALDKNPQIAEARLGAESADYSISEVKSAYSPSLNLSVTQRSQTNPSNSQLSGGQRDVTNQSVSSAAELTQRLPWYGGTLSVDFTSNRQATSNVFSTFNPSYGSGFTATLTQPLLRNLRFDQTRAQLETTAVNRSIADVQLRQRMATTLNAVRRAYWELVYAMDARETARRSEELARRNLDDNKMRVELGTVAPIDILESEAEVANRHQAVVQADGAWRNAQVNLKQLIVDDTSDPIWSMTLVPTERPSNDARSIDVQGAITNALANRTDLDVARKQRQNSDTSLKLLNEARKPGVDMTVNYALNGIGGTRLQRDNTLGGLIVGRTPGGYLDALSSIAGFDFPTWSVGLNITMPLGQKATDAAYARGQVERRQSDLRLETLELQIAADVTRAAQAVINAEEQVRAATNARQLAEKRLEAEQTRRNAGLSTTFLVLQAQRDVASAQTAELRARLDYRTAVADFELAQQAP